MEVEGERFGQDNLGAILEEGGIQAGLSRFRLSKLWLEGREYFVGHKNKAVYFCVGNCKMKINFD